MKKIIFILIIFLVNINVKASDFSEWTTEKKNEVNLIVEKERRYKYYNKQIIEGEYYIEGYNNIEFPLINKNDYKLTDFSDWSTKEPLLVKNRTIENRSIYYYSNALPVRYVYLYNIGSAPLRIGEFNVFINGREINYLSTCNLCSHDFYRYINNGTLYENNSQIEQNGYFLIDLISYVDINSVDISIGIMDGDLVDKSFKLVFSKEKGENEYLYIINKYNNIKKEFNYNYENMNVGDIEWGPTEESTEEIKETKICKVNYTNYYRYQDKVYKHYKEVLNYSDYMINETDEYPYKDENKYQDYYRYKKEQLNNLEVDKSILLDKINELKELISKNSNIEDYNQLIEQLNNYKIEINRLNFDVESYKSRLEEEKISNKEIINKYENKIFNLKLYPKNNIIYDNPIENSNKGVMYNYGLKLIAVLVILLVIFSLKKKQKLLLSNLYKK